MNVAYTFATSSAAIATVNTTGVVTAVTPGVATITVTATAGTTVLTTATTITVSERTPGLTTLQVSPTTASLSVGGTQQLTAAVQGPRASAATITYGTTAPTIATVSSAGLVTAVGPGTATITVTAQATQDGAFAASSITGLVAVTVLPNAQVAITNLSRGGSTIDLSNVFDQMEVTLAIQPNGQTVSEANVWVCLPAETVPDCAARTNGVPAARQSFTAAGSQSTTVQLYINTAEFTTPDFTSGADANTLYKNGLRTIVATLTTSPAGASTIASNSISQVNFNNPDGWTIRWTAPTNRTNDPNNVTWYGGPSTPDALTPSAQSGTGAFVVVPVIYTPDRTVVQATLNLSSSCSAITDRTRPFAGTYGTNMRDTLAVNFDCTGVATATTGLAPQVTGAVDNNNNAYTGVTSTPAVARSIFEDFSNIANGTTGGYRQSLAYRPNNLYLPHDYAAPTISAFDVRGGTDGTVTYQDSAWVNAAYFLAGANATTTTSAANLRYRISDGNVGLTSANGAEIGAGAAQRNTQFSVCAQAGIPASIATSAAAVNCTTPAATGGITATIGSMNLPESATNFTNTAYFAQVVETDRLGNRARSVVYTTTGTGSVTRTAGVNTGATGPTVFGVDLTAPQVAVVANTGAGAIANFARTDVDSIYSALGNTYGTTNNTNAVFAVRFTDNRAGFPICVEATAATASQGTCRNGTAATNVRAGTFGIQRRSAPTLASVTNDAVNEAIVVTANTSTTAANRYLNVIDAPVSGFDGAFREFSIAIFGATNRVASTATLVGGAPAATTAGYYTFTGSLTDRAGNTTTLASRSVAIDNADPQITGITVPAVLGGGTTVSFGPAGTDDLEALSADLSLRYPQLAFADGFAATPSVTLPNTIRFRRVNNYSTTALLGLWHNPFASVTDNKLTTPIGPGTTLGATGLAVPVPFIQQIATVRANNSPMGADSIFALFSQAARDPRPNQVGARLYDLRAHSPLTGIGNGRSTELTATIFGGQLQTPSSIATTKNWRDTVGGAGIITWQISTVGGVSEFRAETPTSITNPPFTAVYVIRQVGTTEYEYIAPATYAGPLDQGGRRFWRYTINSSALDQGNGVTMNALANGDQIRAIGVDASGNGLSTATTTFGLPLALPAAVALNISAPVTDIANATAAQDITLSLSSNPNSANVIYSCSSNNALVTATMLNATTCRITPNGVAASSSSFRITFTATGSGTNLASNTITTLSTTQARTP